MLNDFSCKNECKTNECCNFFVVHSYLPLMEVVHRDYFKARSVDLYVKPLTKSMKYVAYKIPFKCPNLKNRKCDIYETRPEVCKQTGGGDKLNPFRVAQECPYEK